LIHSIQILGPRGNTLAVHAAGEGRPLFLIHGFPLDYRMWQSQLIGLASRFHVVAVNLRGFGASTLDETDYRIDELAQDVEFLRHHLAGNQPILLGGLSMGGYVAFEYWRQFKDQLSGLILSNTKPTADNEAGKKTREAMANKAHAEGAWPAIEPMLSRLLCDHTRTTKPEVVSEVEQMMRSVSASAIVAAQNAMANRRDFTELLPSIRVPTLVIAGRSDPIAPADEGQLWSSEIPNAIFKVLDYTAHLSPMEAPELFNQAVIEIGSASLSSVSSSS
jgi:3-oxoadipate enol-lactonase